MWFSTLLTRHCATSRHEHRPILQYNALLSIACARMQGVTHISQPPRFSRRPRAHFAHPLEFEFELLMDDLPAPPFWPTIFFQALPAHN